MRILHFVSIPARWNGVMSVLMSYYRSIDRTKVQFDFLCFLKVKEEESYVPEIEALGGQVYYVSKPGSSVASFTQLSKFFELHGTDYAWLHNHEVYLSFLLRPLSRCYGICNFAVHAHATRYSDRWGAALRNWLLCVPVAFMSGITRMACSRAAGTFLFGKKAFILLPNAIDTERYRFYPQCREDYRGQLKLGDGPVVGHIGRFVPQKNHEFILKIFNALHRELSSAKLLLIGDGPLKLKIEQQALEMGIRENILFLSNREDVPALLQVMDAFVLPSLYEGLPMSCLEAQASGLPCLVADTVSREVKYSEGVEFLGLQDEDLWKSKLIEILKSPEQPRSLGIGVPDSARTAERLMHYYLQGDGELDCGA